MTLDDLRALCGAPGWSTGRVAHDVCAGRDAETLRRYLRPGAVLPARFARWLAQVEGVDVADGVVAVRLRATVTQPGGWPKGRPRTARTAR